MAKKKIQADYIVSAEVGNGTAMAIGMGVENRCVLTMQPFTVARRQYNPSFEMGGQRLPFYTFEGIQYTIGIDTTKYFYGQPIQRDTNNLSRYGSRMHRFFVLVSLHKLRITAGKVALTVFMPPKAYLDRDQRESVRLAFLEHSPYHMSYTDEKGDVEAVDIQLTDVKVMPEGASAIFGMTLDENGHPNAKTTMMINTGYVGVVDLGSYTAETLLLRSGEIDPTTVENSTQEGLGVDSFIRQPLMSKYGVANEVIDAAIIEFVATDFRGPVVIAGDHGQYDITDDLNHTRARYFEAVDAHLRERFVPFERLKGLILVGGGSMVIHDHLQAAFGNVSYGQYIAEPHMINVESGFRKALSDNGLHPDC